MDGNHRVVRPHETKEKKLNLINLWGALPVRNNELVRRHLRRIVVIGTRFAPVPTCNLLYELEQGRIFFFCSQMWSTSEHTSEVTIKVFAKNACAAYARILDICQIRCYYRTILLYILSPATSELCCIYL